MNLIRQINESFSTVIMVYGSIITGIILSYRFNFLQITQFKFMIKYTFSSIIGNKKSNTKNENEKTKSITPFQAVSTALSGTIGTGNITGVSLAIVMGGAGSLFWIVVSAFLGMIIKYTEIILAMKYRIKSDLGYHGGAMYYMEHCTTNKKFNIKLAKFFAVACLLASFGIGNLTQSNTAFSALKLVLPTLLPHTNISDFAIQNIFILISFFVMIIMLGGIKSIAKVTSIIVPLMALFYIVCCVIIIIMTHEQLPYVITLIFQDAFEIDSLTGGLFGSAVNQSIQVGFTKGLFTNEAGLGSAPIAHSACENDDFHLQGIWGLFEVFFDTVFMCSLTGLVILLSGVDLNSNLDIGTLTLQAFSNTLGNFAGVVIALSTVMFAIASIIGWSYYGEQALIYLSNSNRLKYKHTNLYIYIYKLIYAIFIYLGAIFSLNLVWEISDIFNSLMMLPNLFAIIMLTRKMKK